MSTDYKSLITFSQATMRGLKWIDENQALETSLINAEGNLEHITAELADNQEQLTAALEDLKSANLCRQCAFNAQCGSDNRLGRRKFGHCDHWEWCGIKREE